jgi:hypothetical protein
MYIQRTLINNMPPVLTLTELSFVNRVYACLWVSEQMATLRLEYLWGVKCEYCYVAVCDA